MLHLEGVELRRGGRVLLSDANLTLHAGQHVGVTGANGSGKSSLFELLLGHLAPDHGSVRLPPGTRLAHMAQEVAESQASALDYVIDGDHELRGLEALLAAAEAAGDDLAITRAHAALDLRDGYNARYRAEQLLAGLGFATRDSARPTGAFSGGWRIRLNLAQALMCPSDVLLLDEPSNHLDLDAITWLEGWLASYPGTLLLISHDRDFLDGVVTHIAHIEQQRLTLYRGNYSAFERQRAERLTQQQALHDKQQQRVREIEAFVRRFRAKASKARQAQSRLKELERMQQVAAAHLDSPFTFRIRAAERLSDPLLSFHDAVIGYAGTPCLTAVNLTLHPGTRCGLLGANGAGKSTLIKALTGELELLDGQRTAGQHLKIGYFAQQQLEALDLEASAAQHLARLDPRASEQVIRDFLGGFAFHGDGALAPIRPFSGGEKARLALAIVAWQRPNLLLLDEPTNHLDLEMRHALTVALQAFDGAIVLVSHDRHLLRHCVDEFLLVEAGTLAAFSGDLDDYHRRLQRGPAAPVAVTVPRSQPSARERRQQAAAQRARLAPLRQALNRLEADLETRRVRLVAIERALEDAALYGDERKGELNALLAERGALAHEAARLEERWLAQQEEIEVLERTAPAIE